MSQASLSASDRAFAVRRLARVLAMRGPLLARAMAGHLRPDRRIDADWRDRYERSVQDLESNDPVFRPAKQWRLISFFFRTQIDASQLLPLALQFFRALLGRIKRRQFIAGGVLRTQRELFRCAIQRIPRTSDRLLHPLALG